MENNTADLVRELLKECNKEGSEKTIQNMARSIDNLPDVKENGGLDPREATPPPPSKYENVVADDGYEYSNNTDYTMLKIVAAFVIGFFLASLLSALSNSKVPQKLTFEDNVLQKFGPDAAPPIRYLHNHLTTKNPNAPAKIFVAAENFEDLRKFNKHVSEVFKEFNVVPEIIDVMPEMSSANLFHEFKELASETEKSLIIINNVNKLKGLAPLTIQRIVDPDTAPSKDATIILTASGISFPENMTTKKQCEIFVRKYLLNIWSSDDLSEEQTEPIISRSTGIVVCLLPSTKRREL